MPNYLRRPLKSSRSRAGSPGQRDRRDGRPQERREPGDAPRIGPMLDDRRVDPLATTSGRIGPMEDHRPGSRGNGRPAEAQDWARPPAADEGPRPTVRIVVRRRPGAGGGDRGQG